MTTKVYTNRRRTTRTKKKEST